MTEQAASPTTTTPESTPAPATTPAATPQKETPAARRERLAAMVTASTKTADPEPASSTDSEAPAAGGAADTAAATPSPSKLDKVRETLRQKAEQRTARAEQETKDKRLADLESRLANSSPVDADAIARRVIDEYERDPHAVARKYGKDPRKLVQKLTTALIEPAALAAAQLAEQGSTDVAKLREEIDAWKKQQQDEAQERAYAAERSAIVQHVTTDTQRWGLLAKLPESRRLAWCMTAWGELQQAGEAYDRELVADAAEALLEEDQKHLAPPKPAEPPASTSQVATPKKSAKTITPELASSSGASRPKTRAERKALLVAQLERGD